MPGRRTRRRRTAEIDQVEIKYWEIERMNETQITPNLVSTSRH
jgi:hypothetical protein